LSARFLGRVVFDGKFFALRRMVVTASLLLVASSVLLGMMKVVNNDLKT